MASFNFATTSPSDDLDFPHESFSTSSRSIYLIEAENFGINLPYIAVTI
ncbi:hypothetical protein HMPREF9418_0370 [Neisseria macacae ATCC 33926]|uniref:Uncharacterized protein n=1 Tax=Neisseria macacae ATCC 33926 TaxID=997348 RepID=A0AA36ULA3_9NEIS|nr:hypothetical protein HMPREF9418_0370 [Neisseria macacae ATCC 33926]